MTAVALWGCGPGPEILPPGHTFDERDFKCEDGAQPPCMTTVEANSDADRTHELPADLDGETRTFVVNFLNIPDGDDGTAAGFNLDNRDSGPEGSPDSPNCEEFPRDLESATVPDQVGVDNALVSVLSQLSGVLGDFDVNMALAEQLSSGSLLLLVEVRGIDSLSYDDEVMMQLSLGVLPAGATLEFDGDGLIAASQAFDIDMPVGPAVSGTIYDGRLQATTPQLPLAINVSDATLNLLISNAQVRFDIGNDGLTNGQIGGVITLDDLIEAAVMIPAAAEFCDGDPECPAARSLIEPSADITPVEGSDFCAALSVGIAFDATTATTN
jgi:hypothetical protein